MTTAEIIFSLLSPAAPFVFAGLVWLAFGGASDWLENKREARR